MFEPRSTHRWALLFGTLALGGCAASNARSPSPSVVWTADRTAYVGSTVDGALAIGDSIEFIERRHTVATGSVASLGTGRLATVMIVSGDLAGVKDLKHVTVRAHRATLAPMNRLRVGFPSAKRGTAFFACRSVELRAPAGSFTARDSGATTIFTRDSSSTSVGPWPGRLEARRFDDVADEEIALERGEIDVAIFWPGELSAHMRNDPRWSERPWGLRARGVVAVEWSGTNDPSLSLRRSASDLFAELDHEAFRDDLTPLPSPPGPVIDEFPSPPAPPESLASVRFEIDPRCPGHFELQRALDRLAPKRSTVVTRSARLIYLDEPIAQARAGTRRGADGGLIDPLFSMGCPVVSQPELRPFVRSSLGTYALVNLIDCKP